MVKISFNTNELGEIFKQYCELVAETSEAAVREVVEEGRQIAESTLASAEYDGEKDAKITPVVQTGPMEYGFAMEGDSAPFIEFGTGVKGPQGASFHAKSQIKGDNSFWYFNADGRNIKGTRSVYKVKGRTRYYYMAGRGKGTHKRYIDPWQFDDWNPGKLNWDGDRPVSMNYMKSIRRESSRKSPIEGAPRDVIPGKTVAAKREIFEEPAVGGEKQTKQGYVTWGNPPNNVIAGAREYIASEVEKRVAEYIRKMK